MGRVGDSEPLWTRQHIYDAVDELVVSPSHVRNYCVKEDDVLDLVMTVVDEYEGLLKMLREEMQDR